MAFKKTISPECVGCEALCGPNTNKKTCTEAIHSVDFQKIIQERKIKYPWICSDLDETTKAAVLTELVPRPKERRVIAKIEEGVFYKRVNIVGEFGLWV